MNITLLGLELKLLVVFFCRLSVLHCFKQEPDIVIMLLGTYVDDGSKAANHVSTTINELKDCVDRHLVSTSLLLESEIDSLTQ